MRRAMLNTTVVSPLLSSYRIPVKKNSKDANKWFLNCPKLSETAQTPMSLPLRNRTTTAPDYIIVDECHLAAAKTYVDIFERFPDTKRLGLTATPCRMDGSGFEKLGSALVVGPTVTQMNDMGSLVPGRCWSIPIANLAEIRTTRKGEYDMHSASQQYEKQALIGGVVDEYLKHAPNRKGIVFCTSVKHSERVRDEFIARGIRAEHIDGTTPGHERAATLAALEAGRIQVVTNCSVLVEGLDITSISAISLAVPTRSLSKYLQMVGRAARPHAGKSDYIILDHGGCVLRHGTPDYEREWDIKTRKRKVKAEKGMVMARVCGECMYANPPGEEVCLQCGEVLMVERTVDERGGNLIEIKTKQAPVSRVQYRSCLLYTSPSPRDQRGSRFAA